MEEYFYRPALGEFAPAPEKSQVNLHVREKPYFDKFGRSFMRTIYVMRIKDFDTSALSRFFHSKIQAIHSAPVNPKKPAHYSRFNFFKESCTTIIRDGLRQAGFPGIKGILPLKLFMSASTNVLKEQKKGRLKVEFHTLPQLKVKEAPHSAPPRNAGGCGRRFAPSRRAGEHDRK